MTDTFAVHLGGGAYLESTGRIVFGAPDNAQIYQAPGGFKIDAKKIQEAAKDLSGLLPDDDDAKKKWAKWGVPADIVNFLGQIAGVASIVATAISVYAWVIGVAIAVMDLMTDDEGMSPELAKTLYSIKSQLQGLEQIERADKMIAMHAQFDGRIDRMHGLLTRLAIEKPVGSVRAGFFRDMQAILDELAVPLSQVRNQEWAVTYDAESYKGRGFASSLLVYQRSDGTTPGVPMAPPTVTHFDYRLGVPMLLYSATTFAGLAQVAMPWFRSAGVYAGQLRKTAEAIDRFVVRMQDESLSRTFYTADTVLQQRVWSVFEIPMGGGPRGFGDTSSYAVGAFDLVRYDDNFLWDRYVAEFTAGESTSPRGLFDYHWETPLTQLDQIAIAANEKAAHDYANLQIATGMLRLISTSAWLRFLATPPDRSQTVSGSASDQRSFVSEVGTIATSPWIFPGGKIESPATKRSYDARSRARITTQEPGYAPAFNYRVVLRALDSATSHEGWYDQSYVGDVWAADYEPTAADPRANRLRTSFYQGRVLSEVVLHEGASPSDAFQVTGSKKIRATTFDWYAPVLSPFGAYVDVSDFEDLNVVAATAALTKSKSSGGTSIHLMASPLKPALIDLVAPTHLPDGTDGKQGNDSWNGTMPVMKGSGPLLAYPVEDLIDLDPFALPDVSLDKAERRHVRVEDVDISWQLDWSAGHLQVRLFGKPDQRPFQVHLVVEELVYSGEVMSDDQLDPLSEQTLREQIHTPFVAEIVNQIIFVPERFFDDERRAIEQGTKMWHDFLRRFAEARPIGPGEPIEHLDHSIREQTVRSLSTASLAAAIAQRVEFAAAEAPELWESVVSETRGS